MSVRTLATGRGVWQDDVPGPDSSGSQTKEARLTRTFLLAALAATGLTALSASGAAAACGGEVRFERGTSHAAIKGRLSGTETCDYTLRASKGQVLSAALDAPNGVEVIVFDPVEHALVPGEPLVLPKDATYTVRVLQTRNAARQNAGERAFALSVKVANAGAPAAKPGAPAAAAAPAAKPAKPATAATTCEGSGTLRDGQANMSGALSGYDVCTYAFSAKAGQTFTLLMDAPARVEAMLRAPNTDTAMPVLPDSPMKLETAGDYTLTIARTRNDARKGGAAREFSAVATVE